MSEEPMNNGGAAISEPLPTRAIPPRRTRGPATLGRRIGAVIGLVVATGAAGALAVALGVAPAPDWRRLLGSSRPEFERSAVIRTTLPLTVVARGELASTDVEEVVNRVEGQSTIIRIVPEGTRVQKGDLVCELDSAALRDALTNQTIATRSAESDLETAVKTREVAEISVQEYLNGTYVASVQTAHSSLVLAQSELARATDRFRWSVKMLGIDYISESQKINDALSLLRAETALKAAQTSLMVLKDYSGKKAVIELEAAVQRARSNELSKRAVYVRELRKQKKLEDQIAKCKLYAEGDGLVVYAKDRNPRPDQSGPTIIEGAIVRERQRIFGLPDITRLRVDAKLNESEIAGVAPNQPARIDIDGLPGRPTTGVVSMVRLLPDRTGNIDTGVKVYTSHVNIDEPPPGSRPGMSAQVEILVGMRQDVLAIPVRAVLRVDGRDGVLVVTPDGFEHRPVRLGATTPQQIEVLEGLSEGEVVALDPHALLAE